MKSFIKKHKDKLYYLLGTSEIIKTQTIEKEREYNRLKNEMATKMPENLGLFGNKKYSQTDEDGIIEEIFKRIPNNKTFLEIGVQTGIECNTHYLLLKGWRGIWVEGSKEYCLEIEKELNGRSFPNRFSVLNSFIDRENIVDIFKQSHNFLSVKELDFFSLDIDGNDFYIMEELLNNSFKPKVVCVEYNGKFNPPMKMKIKYNKSHVWDSTDYMGCALQDYVDLFLLHDYSLVCCNIPGFNAFFVRNEYASLFTLYSTEDTYQPFRFYLSPINIGNSPSLKFLRDNLEDS